MRPTILLEVNNSGLVAQGHSSEALLSELQEALHYRICSFSNETGRPMPWARGAFTSPNVLAIPRERQDVMVSLGIDPAA